MAGTNNKQDGFNLYEVRTTIPVLLILAILLGFFQNCSSSWTQDRDLNEQTRAEEINPVIFGTNAVSVTRLEGTPLNISVPANLFEDQGLTYCPSATYDWSFVSGSSSPVPMTSVTTSSLQITSLSLADEGEYYVDVTCQGQVYNLGPVILDVVPRLTIDSSNVTNQTVNQGSPAQLNATFSGPSPITYQWYFTADGGARVALAGETSQTLSIASAQLGDQGSYELQAASAEGGIGQSITAGPGRLTVIPISAVSGTISGDSQVVAGQPISLTSQVSGAVNPTYQWYFNSQPISGETNPAMEIPVSALSDTGTYSLVVNEGNIDYQIGSLDVTVICSVGQVAFNNQCLPSSRVCQLINGTGIQFVQADGTYGLCTVTACDPGYINVNNSCVPSQGSCPVRNGTGYTVFDSSGNPGTCIVQSCDPGFINVNNECTPRICSVQNGVGTIVFDSNNNPQCEVAYCNTDFVKYGGVCVPRIQTCTVTNGVGTQVYTESGPGACNVSSCNTGYVNINNACVSRDCPVQNGQGILALSPSGSVSCRAISCDPGYFLYNNQCSSQSCSVNNGAGFWSLMNGQRVCKVTSCAPGYAIINNQCVQTSCPIANGIGNVALDNNGQTYCQAISCNDGYVISGRECIPGAKSCNVANGSGAEDSNGNCIVQSCDPGYVAYSNQCVAEVQSCNVENGTGIQTYTSQGPGICVVQSCNRGYVQQGNICVAKKRACNVANGTGYQVAFSNGYGPCELESCNAGFGATTTNQCLPEKRACFIGTGQGYQYLTPYGYTACQLENCPEGYSLLNGYCQLAENRMCNPTEPFGKAHKGKVFGRLYSLNSIKSMISIQSSNLPGKRVVGEVFYNNINIEKSDDHPYLVYADGKRVQHLDGAFMKNWYGLELFSQVVPPDGASSGDYIFGLASDDGSALDCKVDGSWHTYVNNGSSQSCSTIKAASGSINIAKDRPLPIRVRYYQNSGQGRCLKLYYKKLGSSGGFKVVPKKYMRLPDGTQNNCPNTRTPSANPNTNVTLESLGFVTPGYACGTEVLTMYKPSTKECLKANTTCEKQFAWTKGFAKDIYNYCY